MRISITLFLGMISSLALAPVAESAAADAKRVVLNEKGYLRTYVQFGIDRIDPKLLKKDGERLMGKRALKRLEKSVKNLHKTNGSKDWSKTDWRDVADVWFSTTQWGTGKRAAFHNHRTPPPGDWMKPEFDDGGWWREKMPVMSGDFYSPRRGWGAHEMQQMEVRAACFRAPFDIEDPEKAGDYTLSVIFRGGARVFVNGEELARAFVPKGDLPAGACAQTYSRETYLRLEDEFPTKKGVKVKRHDVDFCADLIGHFEDGARDPKTGKQRDFYSLGIGFGSSAQVINRKGWNRITGLRNRRIDEIKIPKRLLKKGRNVVAVEVRAAKLNPVVVTGKGNNWGVSYFLHATYQWSHCRLLGLSLRTTDSKAATGLKRPAGTQVWVEDMHRRCVSGDYVNPGHAAGTVRFVGAPNGSYSAQVVIGTDKKLTGIVVSPEALKSTDGNEIPATAVRVGSLKPTPLTRMVKMGLVMSLPVYIKNPLAGGEAALTLMRHAPEGPRVVTLPGQDRIARMEKIDFYDHITPSLPASVDSNTCRPIWLSLDVPPDAKPGKYAGSVTVQAKGMKPVVLPMQAEIFGWKVPQPKDFATVIALELSPYAVARQYEVKPWSEEHWRLVEASFRQAGRVGNDWLFVPVIHETEFGNQKDAPIRWIRKKDGTLTFDYSVLDRYVDLAVKHWGVPRVISFVVMHGAGRVGGAPNAKVNIFDEAQGKIEEFDVSSQNPKYGDYWKAFSTSLYTHMKARKLEKTIHWGYSWDTHGEPTMIPLLAGFTPTVPWSRCVHNGGADKVFQATATATSGEIGPWCHMGWRNTLVNLCNPRMGNQIISSNGTSPPFTFRMMVDRSICAGKSGLGRLGADYWKGTYFLGHKGIVAGGYAGLPCLKLLWPGKNGAESSARFESLREGIQETEARIFVEKALHQKLLPNEMARRLRSILHEHNRETLYVSAGRVCVQITEYAVGWQQRSRRLYAAAAEVAEVMGFAVDRTKIVAELPALGKESFDIGLSSWSATPRAWKASADQAWIVPEKTEGKTSGRETLKVTLDATKLKPDAKAKGILTIQDGAAKRTFKIPVNVSVGKVFDFVMPRAFDYLNRKQYGEPNPISPRAVFNVQPGASQPREFPLINYSGKELKFSIASSVPWIKVEPATATLKPGQNQFVRVTATPAKGDAQTVSGTITVTEEGTGRKQEGKIIAHVIVPTATGLKRPEGPSVSMQKIRVKSHRGRHGDTGGPAFGGRTMSKQPIPKTAMACIVAQETVYDISDINMKSFAAEVRVHPSHVKDVRHGLNKMKVNFEIYVDGKIRTQSGLMMPADEGRLLVVNGLENAKEIKFLTRFDVPEATNVSKTWQTLFLFAYWDEPRFYALAEELAKVAVSGAPPLEWNLIGPFKGKKTAHAPEREFRADARYPGADGEIGWRTITSKTSDIMLHRDLGKSRGGRGQGDWCAYGLVYAHCPEDMDVELAVTYSKELALWVNGQPKLKLSSTGYDLVRTRLKKGTNPILLKSGCYAWNWRFRLQIRAPRSTLEKIKLSTKAE